MQRNRASHRMRGYYLGIEPITLEELGARMGIALDVLVEVELIAGEPKTWDYPGSPTEFYILSVTVTGYCDETRSLAREDRPDWFALLDRIAAARIDREEVLERITERLE